MTAPVLKTYQSTGAPTLDGTAGSGVAVLDWFLTTQCGWSIAFTGTNKRAYRAPAGNRFYLRVDDSHGITMYLRGYEAMTDVDTGTNPFPTVAQYANGGFFCKAETADGTVRPWKAIGDNKRFMLHSFASVSNNYYSGMWYGDIKTRKANDCSHTLLVCDPTVDQPYSYCLISAGYVIATTADTSNCDFLARPYTQVPGAVQAALMKLGYQGGNSGQANIIAGPDAIGGEYWALPIYVHEGVSLLRGTMPGIWHVPHDLQTAPNFVADRQQMTIGSRTFEFWRNGPSSGGLWVETSNTWDV